MGYGFSTIRSDLPVPIPFCKISSRTLRLSALGGGEAGREEVAQTLSIFQTILEHPARASFNSCITEDILRSSSSARKEDLSSLHDRNLAAASGSPTFAKATWDKNAEWE